MLLPKAGLINDYADDEKEETGESDKKSAPNSDKKIDFANVVALAFSEKRKNNTKPSGFFKKKKSFEIEENLKSDYFNDLFFIYEFFCYLI